jgi:phenylalanyl-tRNA synthetase beta subunit
MRANIKDGLSGALELNAKNAPLLGLDVVKIFEVGTIFKKDGEYTSLAMGIKAVVGKQGKAENILREDIAKLLKELNSKSEIKVIDGIFEITLDNIIKLLPEPSHYNSAMTWDTDARFTQWSQYPFILRDIAVWVPKSVSDEDVLKVILENATDLLVRHDKFDEFEKDGRISFAWHLVFQSKEKTLTDDEVGDIMQKITSALNANGGWEVR